ncbi:MAG TPA: molybdate ABC transporter substrate-binding protein [Acidobacteriaceae bacterium]
MFSLAMLCVLPGTALAQQKPAAGSVTIHVAAAADLQPVMPLIAAGFEKETGIHVAVSYGSSSSLAAQIINGAPTEVFFSADYSFAERVVAANLTDTPAPILYAKGTLVLWERKDGPFQPLTLTALTNPALKSVAVANPLTAPYGMAAVAAMKHLHVYEKVVPHFVQAENVAQAAEYADTGNSQLAFISLTLAKSARMTQTGTYVVIPDSQYPEIRQCAVVMRKAAHPAEGRRFLEYVLSGPIQAQFAQFGLTSKDQ